MYVLGDPAALVLLGGPGLAFSLLTATTLGHKHQRLDAGATGDVAEPPHDHPDQRQREHRRHHGVGQRIGGSDAAAVGKDQRPDGARDQSHGQPHQEPVEPARHQHRHDRQEQGASAYRSSQGRQQEHVGGEYRARGDYPEDRVVVHPSHATHHLWISCAGPQDDIHDSHPTETFPTQTCHGWPKRR